MSQIYNLTSNVTVASFQMKPTPNFDIISAWYSEKCVQSFTSLSYRVATLSTQMQRGQLLPPQRPAGGAEVQRPPG